LHFEKNIGGEKIHRGEEGVILQEKNGFTKSKRKNNRTMRISILGREAVGRVLE